MTPPRRAIIAVTSAHASLFDGTHTTGLFIGEALHPFNVFKNADFEVDFVSVTGKYTPDWLSEQPDFLPPDNKAQWEDLKGEFRDKLDHHLHTPDQVDASKVSFTPVTFCRLWLMVFSTVSSSHPLATPR